VRPLVHVAYVLFVALTIGIAAADQADDLDSLVRNIQQDIQPHLREAISQPDSPRSFQSQDDAVAMIKALRAIPKELNPVWEAQRYRMIAFLEVMLARLESERIAYTAGTRGADPARPFLAYGRSALSDILEARKAIDAATVSSTEVSPGLLKWMTDTEDIPGHLLHLEAHAHAMIWKATDQTSEHDAAEKAWSAARQTSFGRKNMQPSPELANALDLYRWHEDPKFLMTLFWVGVGLIGLAVVLAIFIPHPSPFQMFVFRIVASLGAAGIGASVPGFIGVKTPLVNAGGAVALLVLIYLVNPPKLARNLAGNP